MKSLHERIIETCDRLSENTINMLEYVNRGERPPEHLAVERDRLVNELTSLDEERGNGDAGEPPFGCRA